jgi:hypothetical protein
MEYERRGEHHYGRGLLTKLAMMYAPRGFALLVALIFMSVILSVGLELTDITYKQIMLASTSRQSQYAFYNADSAMECALELDQVYDAFDYATGPTTGAFGCEGQVVTYTNSAPSGNSRTATFSIPCTGGGTNSTVTILKNSGASISTYIYSNGYNDCSASDPNRIQRGLKSNY